MTKVLITGADGQLGRSLRKCSHQNKDHFLFTNSKELDICDPLSIRTVLKSFKPDYIINCAAYTAVDKAEEDRIKAFQINRDGVINLINESSSLKSKIIHISTDYVFNGNAKHPYKEDDELDPRSVYGHSKAEGEKALIELAASRSIIIRTSWLYSEFGHNFLKTMLRLGAEKESINVVNDQFGSPSYASDLANAILMIIDKNITFGKHSNLLHFSNSGLTNWYEFATAIMKFSHLNCKIKPIPTSSYPTAAKRPVYSELNCQKIEGLLNYKIRDWKMALKECLFEINLETK
jgi:dTDP-4-dehydrorhamnose reductase